jgi:hypothetical protein
VLPLDKGSRSIQNGQTKRFGLLAAIEGRQDIREEVRFLGHFVWNSVSFSWETCVKLRVSIT